MLFGGVEKTWLFCDVEKSDRLSGVLEACDEALLGNIITNEYVKSSVIVVLC